MKRSLCTLLILMTLGSSVCFSQEKSYGQTCLALVMFAEARSEGTVGMALVGQVVLNRLKDKDHRFGDNVCDVVNQIGQFEGMTLWPTPRHPESMNPIEWDAALAIANELEANGIDSGSCSGALYFNQTRRDGFLCHVGVHYFYK